MRWSAAKGVARIAERLPRDLCREVFETVLGLFEVHWFEAAGLYGLPAISEGTWHGACLACAEIARRSLVEPLNLPELIGWLSKVRLKKKTLPSCDYNFHSCAHLQALYFDLRKGAHSIGSNVRDAAAYVLWALARTQNQSALIPHSTNLAQRLAAVALYDREIHIRRAASAAFQEHVGRTVSYLLHHSPHIRHELKDPRPCSRMVSMSWEKPISMQSAFGNMLFSLLHPKLPSESWDLSFQRPPSSLRSVRHPEYRDFLVDHLLNVVLRHWDISMRELGSESLRLICSLDLEVLAPRAIQKIVSPSIYPLCIRSYGNARFRSPCWTPWIWRWFMVVFQH